MTKLENMKGVKFSKKILNLCEFCANVHSQWNFFNDSCYTIMNLDLVIDIASKLTLGTLTPTQSV
jgi:hypothetical protein